MRACLFSFWETINEELKKEVLHQVRSTTGHDEIELVCLTYHRKARQGPHPDQPYIISGNAGWKLRMSCALLRMSSALARMFRALAPQFYLRHPRAVGTVGGYAVRLCEGEFIETFLGCDPDVIFFLDKRWAMQFQRLISERPLPWTCLDWESPQTDVNQGWRKYDPSVRVSVVLPTYNGSTYIRKSVESCLGQTHENIELIVVDDGSNEAIRPILNKYDDPRLKIISHDQNLGVAAALNTGFRNSTGEYLTWTSDDNYYAPNAIEVMVRYLQTYSAVDFVYAESFVIGENDQEQPREIWRNQPPEWLKIDNGVGACFLYGRKVYETIGEYNPRVFLAEDYDYWVRVSKQFKLQRLLRPLYYYRRHAGSLTAKYRPEQVAEKVSLVKSMNRMSLQG